MRLCGLDFEHKHILDTKAAPRGQLPYLVDGEEFIGDSDAIGPAPANTGHAATLKF